MNGLITTYPGVAAALWLSLSFIAACIALTWRRKNYGHHPDDGAAFILLILLWPIVVPIGAVVLIFYVLSKTFENVISPTIDKMAGIGKEQ